MEKNNCAGCSENFYNGNNPYGVEECWHFKAAKVIYRKRVSVDQRPPWTQKAGRYPSCYRQKGFVFVGPHQEK